MNLYILRNKLEQLLGETCISVVVPLTADCYPEEGKEGLPANKK